MTSAIDSSPPHPDLFQETMRGLADGLRVRHIATFQPETCDAEESARRVWSNPLLSDFDQVPVCRDGRIVGVLERPRRGRGAAADLMVPLSDALLVSAEAPLMSFVRIAADEPYRLVLGATRIEGIVTRSDLLKLPVRLLAFALVTHLEMVMAEAVRAVCGLDDERLLGVLNSARRRKLLKKRDILQSANIHPNPLLEITDFGDKGDAVAKLYDLNESFMDEIGDIKELRNRVAHAAGYARDDGELGWFVERMRAAEKWIETIPHASPREVP